MMKIVKWLVKSVPSVAPTLLPFMIIAVGMESRSWKPNGMVQP